MRKYFAIFLLIIFTGIICGCAGSGSLNNVLEDSGIYKMSVLWPGMDDRNQSEPDSRLIPSLANKVTVSVTGTGIINPATGEIDYPETSVIIENLPPGAKVAHVRCLDVNSNLLVQRKEAFMINPCQTTDSGNLPLGVAITGTTSSPAFEPSSVELLPNAQLYFQNWTEGQLQVRTNVRGTDYDLTIPGIEIGTDGLYSFGISGIAINRESPFSIIGMPSVSGLATTPPIQKSWIRLVDLIPKDVNGKNGITCQRRPPSSASYSNLTRTPDNIDYRWNGVCNTWYTPRINILSEVENRVAVRTGVYYEDTNVKYNCVLRVRLNGNYGQMRFKGVIRLEPATQGGGETRSYVKYMIYKGTGNYNNCIRSGYLETGQTISVSFDHTIPYNDGDYLYFDVDPLGAEWGDMSELKEVEFKAVP